MKLNNLRSTQMLHIKNVLDKADLEMLDKQRDFLEEAIIFLQKEKPITAEHLRGLQNFLDALTDAIKDH